MVAGLFLEGYAAGVQGKPFSSLDDDPYNARRFGHLRGSKLHSEAAKEAELFGYDASFGRL